MGLGACSRALIVLTIASGAAVSQPETSLDAWLEAVNTHEPGGADAALALAVRTSSSRLLDLRFELQRWLKVTGRAERANAVYKRAAQLHFDAAVALNESPKSFALPPVTSPRAGGPGSGGGSIIVEDGRVTGYDRGGFHWRFGRDLLNAVAPAPAADEYVRLWYQAATAYMANAGQLSDIEPHLERARGLWPKDAWVYLDLGCRAEYLAAPRVQVAARSSSIPIWITVRVGNERTQLDQARDQLRRAVSLDPTLAAARLRLGRVLGQLGRHEEALEHLALAAADGSDAPTRYLAHLFAGRSYEALAKREEARQAYSRAASLFPRAQTPWLSLGQLAGPPGPRVAARASLERVLMLPGRRDDGDDPWWLYHAWHATDGDRTIAQLRDAVPTPARR